MSITALADAARKWAAAADLAGEEEMARHAWAGAAELDEAADLYYRAEADDDGND